MALTLYCEFDEVRAALGVNALELSDAALALPVYEIGLVRELAKVSTSLPAAFSGVCNISETARTPLQRALHDAVHMFSVYTVAKQAGAALPLLAPKDIGDGKATLSRFASEPYKAVLQNVEVLVKEARETLEEALAALEGTVDTDPISRPARSFMASSRSYDPVTGS